MLQVARQLGIRASGHLMHKRTNYLAALQHVQHIFTFPTALTNYHQMRAGIAQLLHQFAPDREQQQMVFARLYGAQHDKIRLAQRRRRLPHFACGQRRRRQPGDHGRRHGQALAARKVSHHVERELRITDHRGAGLQHGLHAPDVQRLLAGTAVFRVGDGNQVVHEINRLLARSGQPLGKAAPFHAGMTEVKTQLAPRLLRWPRRQAGAGHDARYPERQLGRRRQQQRKQRLRLRVRQHATPAAHQQHRLRALTPARNIGQTDAVHPRRQAPPQGTPEQATNVDENLSLHEQARLSSDSGRARRQQEPPPSR